MWSTKIQYKLPLSLVSIEKNEGTTVVVFEVNPLTCPKCQTEMRIIAFLTDYAVVDKIINCLKLTFVPDKPPLPQAAFQELFSAAEENGKYFMKASLADVCLFKGRVYPKLSGLVVGGDLFNFLIPSFWM